MSTEVRVWEGEEETLGWRKIYVEPVGETEEWDMMKDGETPEGNWG